MCALQRLGTDEQWAALARQAPPIEPSPDGQIRPTRNSALDLPDVEDGPDPIAPRLSMPLDDMYEDDSFQEAPPRQSLLPDLPDDVDTGTMHSLEFGRRALSEDPRAMFTARMSERFADLNELGVDGEEYEVDGTFINRRSAVDPDQLLQEAIEEALEDTGEIQALTGRRDGRPSDVDLGVFGELDEPDEPTFRFTIPQRIRVPVQDELIDPILLNQDVDEEGDGQPGQDEDPDILPPDDEVVGGFDATGWESDQDAEDDVDLQAYREEMSAVDRSMLRTQSPERSNEARGQVRRQRREMRTSKSGHDYPSFPSAVVKRLANGLAKSQGANAKISKDTLLALVQATDWFFEQVGEDLAAYAQHAGRKMIEDRDMIALMKRYVVFIFVTFIIHMCTWYPAIAQTLTTIPDSARLRITRHPSPSLRKCFRESCYRSSAWSLCRS